MTEISNQIKIKLSEIERKENIEISEEERDSEINNLAKEYGLDVETVKEALTDDMLDHDIKLKQAIDIIVSSANESLESEEEEK